MISVSELIVVEKIPSRLYPPSPGIASLNSSEDLRRKQEQKQKWWLQARERTSNWYGQVF